MSGMLARLGGGFAVLGSFGAASGQEVVFASHNAAPFVSMVHTGSGAVETIAVGGNNNGMAALADGSALYVVVSQQGVKKIDTATKQVVATVPITGLVFGIAITPDGSRAVVTRGNPANIFIVDLAMNAVVSTLTPISNAVYVEMSPDGSRAYVSTSRIAPVVETWVSVVDVNAPSILDVIDIGAYPAEMRITPDGSRLYISNELSQAVTVLNTANHSIVGTTLVGVGPRGITFNPGATRAYVMNSNTGTASILDTATNAVVGSVNLNGGFPMSMAVLGNGTTAYVSRWSGQSIAVVDLVSNTVTGNIPLAARPYMLLRANLPGCYANCDGSTTAPALNVADFSCFLTKFAGGDAYANCDQSTTAPVLNVADFSCFLTKFAAGCP